MTDLRKIVTKILTDYGHDILLQRVQSVFDGKEPDYTTILERHTVRHMDPASSALPMVGQEQMEGIRYDVDYVYWFKWDVTPISGDRIYENVDRYPNYINSFIIDYAKPMRGAGGRIEFWVVGASRETPYVR